MSKNAVHEEILELLPWFINESLGARERDRVMVHLAECMECREERDRLQTIEMFVKKDDTAVPDYQFSYRKLLGRIEEAERNKESTSVIEDGIQFRGLVPFLAIAASLFVSVVLVGMLQSVDGMSTQHRLSNSPAEAGEYRTLSTQVQSPGVSRRIAITFEQPIQARAMRSALIDTRSNIVSGPDATGVYLVDVMVPESLSMDVYLSGMRNIEGIQQAMLVSREVEN